MTACILASLFHRTRLTAMLTASTSITGMATARISLAQICNNSCFSLQDDSLPYLKLRRCPHHLEAGHSSLPVGHGGHHHVGHGGGYVLKTKNTQNDANIKNYFLLIRLNRRNEIREPINISFTYIEKFSVSHRLLDTLHGPGLVWCVSEKYNCTIESNAGPRHSHCL